MTSSDLPLAGRKILVAEDDVLVAQDIITMLARSGGITAPAFSCAQAREVLGREHFDGAVLDVQLQDGASTDIARLLKARHIPFIVATGYAAENLAFEMRGAPYIAKPFSSGTLIELAQACFPPGRP